MCGATDAATLEQIVLQREIGVERQVAKARRIARVS